jgi:3-deoxy-D-manno-octulosonic-acid transferase
VERVLFILYNLLFHLLGLAAIPVFLMKIAKYKHSFKQKLGFLPQGTLEGCRGSPRIWVNAVSVGEVVAVSPIVKAIKKLYPKSCIIVSTGTETGQNMARQLRLHIFPGRYAPGRKQNASCCRAGCVPYVRD